MPQAVSCPICSYLNAADAAVCGLCGYVPPRATESQKTDTAQFRRPSIEKVESATRTTDRIARTTTDRVETRETDRVVKTSRVAPPLQTEPSLTITCPLCSYPNPLDVAVCGMCGYVPSRATESQESEIETAQFRRPSVERAVQNARTGDRSETRETDRVVKTARVASPTDPLQPEVHPEIVQLRKEERQKKNVATVMSTGRLIRRALTGFIVLLVICLFREGLVTFASFESSLHVADLAQVVGFCLLFGLPIGFIVGWHGGGTFRGLLVAGQLFTFEPLLISWITGRDVGWSIKELLVGLLAGFLVGLFIEIDS